MSSRTHNAGSSDETTITPVSRTPPSRKNATWNVCGELPDGEADRAALVESRQKTSHALSEVPGGAEGGLGGAET